LSSSIFWGPMAMAIMGGLIAATVLTLVFVPALYMVWMKPSGPGTPYTQAEPSVSLT
jgi:Cu/Ag efflux pump CusA